MIGLVARIVLALLGGTITPALSQVIAPTAPPPPEPASQPRLSHIRSWGYQLQRTDAARVARSPYDLVVVDYSRSGTEAGRFGPADIEAMRRKPDGGRRVVLAYLSIGEAEDYRYYWRGDWVEAVNVLDEPADAAANPARAPGVVNGSTIRLRAMRLPKLGAPSWLGRENEAWPGNYLVRYWDPDWQKLIYASANSYLSRILAAGFDGVYLDRIDTYQAVGDDRPEARSSMVRLVTAIAEKARRIRPGFLVVPQNGEQLLSDPAYLAAIDAIAKEDLLVGEKGDGERNSINTVSRTMRWLAPAINRGIPVLIVEYVREKPVVDALRADIVSRGFVPYFGVRALDRLILPEDILAAPGLAAPSQAPSVKAAPVEARTTKRGQIAPNRVQR